MLGRGPWRRSQCNRRRVRVPGVVVGKESPLSDTTDLLTESASAAKPRRRSTGGITGMKLPELQTLASELGITGTARMRKSDLITAIKAKQGGSSGQDTLLPVEEPAAPVASEAPRRRGRRVATRAAGTAAPADTLTSADTAPASEAPTGRTPRAPVRAGTALGRQAGRQGRQQRGPRDRRGASRRDRRAGSYGPASGPPGASARGGRRGARRERLPSSANRLGPRRTPTSSRVVPRTSATVRAAATATTVERTTVPIVGPRTGPTIGARTAPTTGTTGPTAATSRTATRAGRTRRTTSRTTRKTRTAGAGRAGSATATAAAATPVVAVAAVLGSVVATSVSTTPSPKFVTTTYLFRSPALLTFSTTTPLFVRPDI